MVEVEADTVEIDKGLKQLERNLLEVFGVGQPGVIRPATTGEGEDE